MLLQEQPAEAVNIPTDISDYIDKIDQDDDEEEVTSVERQQERGVLKHVRKTRNH